MFRNSKRLYNPHTRGRLAECLAYFIPRDSSGLNQSSLLTSNIRAQIFEECGDVVAEVITFHYFLIFLQPPGLQMLHHMNLLELLVEKS